jgi:hypothetical protein
VYIVRRVVTHCKCKGEVFAVRGEYEGNRAKAPLILNLSSQMKGPIYAPVGRAPDPAWTFWRREISFASVGIRTHSLVATPKTLPRFLLQTSVVEFV